MTSANSSSFVQTKIDENKLKIKSNIENENENDQDCYKHLYIVVDQEEGTLFPISFEMLGAGRRLMDDFNRRYNSDEKVVAVILGHNIKHLNQDLISYGADVVIFVDDAKFEFPINFLYTKIISQIITDKSFADRISLSSESSFVKPRYMFFSADDVGRQLSSTVMAELESGLASDINKLVISDLKIQHEHKTKGKPIIYKKTLEMYRPDFSGFLWTTILCLDNLNPDNKKDFYPQSCSIIPGVFSPIVKDINRTGLILEYFPHVNIHDFKVKIIDRYTIKNKIDFSTKKIIVSFGKGIKDSPEQNIRLIENFAKELGAEIGISLPISKKPYSLSENLSSSYMIPERVIGTSGRMIAPTIYIALGISGAVQHIAGMKGSTFVISVNPDLNAPIIDESDIFIKGRIEEVIPVLIDVIKEFKEKIQIPNEVEQ